MVNLTLLFPFFSCEYLTILTIHFHHQLKYTLKTHMFYYFQICHKPTRVSLFSIHFLDLQILTFFHIKHLIYQIREG